MQILHTNDFHGALTQELAERIRVLKQPDGLFFDSGDCIRTGNLGIPVRPEPAWQYLQTAGCTASVIGNRETHLLKAAFEAKLLGAAHPVLCANLRYKGQLDGPLPATLSLQCKGLKVGVVGLSVPMVTEKMTSKTVSAYVWDPPAKTLESLWSDLRSQHDVVILLSHLGLTQDRKICAQFPELDVVLGGHSHSVLEQPENCNGVWIAQGGSHGRYIGVYEWDPQSYVLSGGLQPFNTRVP